MKFVKLLLFVTSFFSIFYAYPFSLQMPPPLGTIKMKNSFRSLEGGAFFSELQRLKNARNIAAFVLRKRGRSEIFQEECNAGNKSAFRERTHAAWRMMESELAVREQPRPRRPSLLTRRGESQAVSRPSLYL